MANAVKNLNYFKNVFYTLILFILHIANKNRL